MKIDPSGRLAWGIFGLFTFIIAIILLCIDTAIWYFSLAFFICSVAVFIWIICKTVKLNKEEQRLQQAIKQSNISEINALTPSQFEDWVARMFRMRGYQATLTPRSNDYGIDVILEREDIKIGIQVKKYSKNVGVAAVQEVISGMRYYDCTEGWVVTSASDFTRQARSLAATTGIQLYAYNDLAILLSEIQVQDNSKG